ncbi:hypothetical protein Hanom_Chr05g00403341 [Helianthus anomalus]
MLFLGKITKVAIFRVPEATHYARETLLKPNKKWTRGRRRRIRYCRRRLPDA